MKNEVSSHQWGMGAQALMPTKDDDKSDFQNRNRRAHRKLDSGQVKLHLEAELPPYVDMIGNHYVPKLRPPPATASKPEHLAPLPNAVLLAPKAKPPKMAKAPQITSEVTLDTVDAANARSVLMKPGVIVKPGKPSQGLPPRPDSVADPGQWTSGSHKMQTQTL